MVGSFKGAHFPRILSLRASGGTWRTPLSYRHVEELM